MDFLKAKGKSLTLGNHSFFLRGVGLGGWLSPEGYIWKLNGREDRPRRIEALVESLCGKDYSNSFWTNYYDIFIQEDDFAWLARWGFNSVRLPFNSRHLLEKDGLNPDYLSHIDDAVRWSKKYGLLLFLDCHGAPGGQTGTNIDDSENDYPALFGNPENERRLLLLWRLLAERYKDEPAIGGFDLLNEPITHWHPDIYPQLVPLYRRLIKEIRTIDPNHLLILEGTHWATDFSVFSELSLAEAQDNLMFEFHKYWSAPDRNSLTPYLSFRQKYEIPLFDGESGENNLYWYSLLFPLLERENISWSFWTFRKMGNPNSLSSFAVPKRWNEVISYCKNGKIPVNPASIFNSFLDSLSGARFHPVTARSILRLAPTLIPAESFDEAKTSNHLPNQIDFRKEEKVHIVFADGHSGLPNYANYAGEPQKKSDDLLIVLQKKDEVSYYFKALEKRIHILVLGKGNFSIFIDGIKRKNDSEVILEARIQKHTITLRGVEGESRIGSLILAKEGV